MVGLLRIPDLAGRIFTAVSRERINIIAIVVHRSGLEKAVQAVHAECRMGELARHSKAP